MTDNSPEVCIPKNTLVQVYFKTGVVVEGVVVSWHAHYAILRAPGGVNNIVIYHPPDNILMVKVVNAPPVPKTIPQPQRQLEEEQEELVPLPPVKRAKERVKAVATERVGQVQKEKKKVASRLREAPKNVAPQLPRYQEPWSSK